MYDLVGDKALFTVIRWYLLLSQHECDAAGLFCRVAEFEGMRKFKLVYGP